MDGQSHAKRVSHILEMVKRYGLEAIAYGCAVPTLHGAEREPMILAYKQLEAEIEALSAGCVVRNWAPRVGDLVIEPTDPDIIGKVERIAGETVFVAWGLNRTLWPYQPDELAPLAEEEDHDGNE